MKFLEPKDQLKLLKKGIVDLISETELLKKLEKSFKEGTPLRIKAGFDPSRPDLHLGHTVLINKMRQFQELGHHVMFLIGDFTARIGDPTGKNSARPPLTDQEVAENSKTYAKQVYKILDQKKTEVMYNAHWFNKMRPAEFIKLTAQYTVARMLERDDFQKRYENETPINIHEFLYPLVQGYDSVEMKADVELGGTDQKFNLIVGREVQKSYGQEPQVVITTPLLEGLDGVKKMSKSEDNYIAVFDTPKEMFGKTLRVSDVLMWRYYELLTDLTVDDIEKMKADVKAGKLHPKKAKVDLAKTLVERFHDKISADKAEREFEEIFVNKGVPDDIQEAKISAGEIWICQLLKDLEMTKSTSDARRMVEQKAVELDSQKVSDPKLKLSLLKGASHILKVGKKNFKRIVVS